MTIERYVLEPDPAWDYNEDTGGVLTVELSWEPDALAARAPGVVASPALVAALQAQGLTGFRTGEARGYYHEDAFGIEAGTPPPALVRLVLGDDPQADFSYVLPDGLIVSSRALAVLQAHCRHLRSTAKP